MNRSAEQRNHPRTASRFTRFACPALRFIPHEPRKKDTHSLSGRHISAYELCVCLCMTTFCHSLSYADARRQHVGRWLSERSEHGVIRTRTSELVAYAEKFYACTKILCVCRRTARTQRARYAHAMRTLRASAAR